MYLNFSQWAINEKEIHVICYNLFNIQYIYLLVTLLLRVMRHINILNE